MTELNPTARDTLIGMVALFAVTTGIATHSINAAIAAAIAAALFTAGVVRGWWLAAWNWSRPFLFRTIHAIIARLRRKKTETAVSKPYTITIGFNPLTGEPDREQITSLGHIYVAGTTRFGKTSMLHYIIHQLISQHTPAELRLLISDPKRLDYAIYASLIHLAQPIARTREETVAMTHWLIAEMERRITKFEQYSHRALCNNLTRYRQLSGERLPHVLAIFDELADVMCPALEDNLERLVKLGAAYGIQLILATQRPSAKSIPGEIISQIASRMVTWMPSAREYGVVSQIPREIYEQMERVPGRFMVLTANGWRIVQAPLISDRELVAVARRNSGRQRQWPGTTPLPESTQPERDIIWSRLPDDEAKIAQILQYADDLGTFPTYEQAMTRFNISRGTAAKYLPPARERWRANTSTV